MNLRLCVLPILLPAIFSLTTWMTRNLHAQMPAVPQSHLVHISPKYVGWREMVISLVHVALPAPWTFPDLTKPWMGECTGSVWIFGDIDVNVSPAEWILGVNIPIIHMDTPLDAQIWGVTAAEVEYVSPSLMPPINYPAPQLVPLPPRRALPGGIRYWYKPTAAYQRVRVGRVYLPPEVPTGGTVQLHVIGYMEWHEITGPGWWYRRVFAEI